MDKLTTMMSKLTAHDENPYKQFKPKYTKESREDNQEISMIEIIMTRKIIKIDIDQIAEIEGQHTEVEISIERDIEEDCAISITIEIIEETLSEICNIIEVNILEVDIEGIIEMIIWKGQE